MRSFVRCHRDRFLHVEAIQRTPTMNNQTVIDGESIPVGQSVWDASRDGERGALRSDSYASPMIIHARYIYSLPSLSLAAIEFGRHIQVHNPLLLIYEYQVKGRKSAAIYHRKSHPGLSSGPTFS